MSTVPAAATDQPALHFAVCRSLGHDWHHLGAVAESDGYSPPSLWGRAGGVGYRSVCRHCGTERIKWITRSGMLAPSTYRYPDGYSRHGEERLSTQAWRRTWIVTLLGEDT
jgi:hypothetical protein